MLPHKNAAATFRVTFIRQVLSDTECPVRFRARILLLAVLVGIAVLAVTPAQAASTRLAPVGTGSLTVVPNSAFGVRPMSMSGCNLDVCITITGSGLHVDRVNGSGKIASYRCTTFDVDVNYTTVYRSNVACGDFGWSFSGQWTPNRNFPNGAKMCVAFRGYDGYPSVVGYPCGTIHS